MPFFRNSDDFFPDAMESHSWHIYANAINALWTAHYPVVGDWDMFQSDHPFAEYHASRYSIHALCQVAPTPSFMRPFQIVELFLEAPFTLQINQDGTTWISFTNF